MKVQLKIVTPEANRFYKEESCFFFFILFCFVNRSGLSKQIVASFLGQKKAESAQVYFSSVSRIKESHKLTITIQ